MDIVLEVMDYLMFDPLYAYALPAEAPYNVWESSQNATDLFSSKGAAGVSGYQYQPSTVYFTLNPSKYAYMSQWPRDNIYRQGLSLFLITWIFGLIVYFIFAGLSYIFVFDKDTFKHPKFLKNQVWLEIQQASSALPVMAILTVPFFLADVRGYAKLYDSLDDAPFPLYNWLQFPFFVLFTDFGIYWIHRGLHHRSIYKHLHKPHHKWIMPSPFASHAFHPVDGWAQSLPYHFFPLLFPLQKFAYVLLFVFINIWTIFIHDGEYISNNPIINGAACHTMHHLYFNYNYGQFVTLWDRLGGSYRRPNDELFHKETKFGKHELAKQVKEMEKMVIEVEGADYRSYGGPESKKTR